MGVLEGSTRVLVTHQLQYLPQARCLLSEGDERRTQQVQSRVVGV